MRYPSLSLYKLIIFKKTWIFLKVICAFTLERHWFNCQNSTRSRLKNDLFLITTQKGVFRVPMWIILVNYKMVGYLKLRLQSLSKGRSELGTLEFDTLNPDRLIWISNLDTFDFLLNPLFLYLYMIPTNDSSLINWRVKFQIFPACDWLYRVLHTLLYWLNLHTFQDTN